MENYVATFIALVDGTKLTVLIAMILANFLLAVAVSIKLKTFRLKQLGDFMVTRIIPYLLGYFAVGVVGVVDPSWQAAVPVAWGVILLALAGAIMAKLKEIGIDLPDSIGGDRVR